MKKKLKYIFLKINQNMTEKEIKVFCKQLCRSISLRYASHLIKYDNHNGIAQMRDDQLFLDLNTLYRDYPSYYLSKSPIEEHNVDLSSSGILTFVWDKDRFDGRLIDGRKNDFKWMYDSINHYVTLIKPFDIYIVTGGNHSIFYGMFYSGGAIKCNNAIDYTNMLKEFNITEKYFIDSNGNKYKKSVFMEIHPELETLFLLGKKLIEINES